MKNIYVIDDNKNRQLSIVNYLSELSISDANIVAYDYLYSFVSDPADNLSGAYIEKLNAENPPASLIFHINTDASDKNEYGGLARQIATDIFAKANLSFFIIYTGGAGSANFGRLPVANPPRNVFFRDHVNSSKESIKEKFESIFEILGFNAVKQKEILQTPVNEKTEVTNTTIETNQLEHFKKSRSDLSHDDFKNSFCNALGFHATDADSTRRPELLLRAGQDEKWWHLLKDSAALWFKQPGKNESDISRKIDKLMEDVKSVVYFSSPKKEYKKLQEATKKALKDIDVIMTKFTGFDFYDAKLSPDEIIRFWSATDCIREWFKSIDIDNNEAYAHYFNRPESSKQLPYKDE